MRSLLISIALVLSTIGHTWSQGASINSTGNLPDASAMLDVSASNAGVLLPRVALSSITDVITIPSPALSLLVYNTNASISGGSGAGFYFWDGGEWKALTGSAGLPCSGAPATPGPIIGPALFYANSTQIFMVAPVAGATDYTWNYTGTGVTISGETNPVAIAFSESATSGVLTVSASCGNGSSTSLDFPITVFPVLHGTQTFGFTGSMQTWQVPPGVYAVTLDVYGGQGQNATNGGKGGRAQGTLAVVPLQNLYIFVGGNGTSYWSASGEGGGNNGGGASSIRIGGIDLASRVIVAGGGGGCAFYQGGCYQSGGAGGGNVGASGPNIGANFGGSGGTQSSGGAGGSGQSGSGVAGSLGAGGYNNSSYGGGGGGYYGGGGGGYFDNSSIYASGGGGSNYLSPILTNTSTTQGVREGHGQVIITY